MKIFFAIFFACYSIFFVAGYFSGRTAAKSMTPQEYFASEIEVANVNGKMYLYYGDETNDTTRYSVDEDTVIDPALWVKFNKGQAFNGPGSNSAVVATGVIGTGTGLIASNYKDIIKIWQKKSANKGRGLFAAIAGAIAGYWQGWEIGKSTFSPQEETAANANLLSDITFWKGTEKKVYAMMAAHLKEEVNIQTATTLNLQDAERRKKLIDSLANYTLDLRADGSLMSSDFYVLTAVSGVTLDNILSGDSDDDTWTTFFQWLGFGLFVIGGLILIYQFLNFLKDIFSSDPKKKKKGRAAKAAVKSRE